MIKEHNPDVTGRRALALRALNRQRRIQQIEELLRKVRAELVSVPVWKFLVDEIDEVGK